MRITVAVQLPLIVDSTISIRAVMSAIEKYMASIAENLETPTPSTSTSDQRQSLAEKRNRSREEGHDKHDQGWVNLCFVFLIAILPVVLCCILVATILLYNKSPSENAITGPSNTQYTSAFSAHRTTSAEASNVASATRLETLAVLRVATADTPEIRDPPWMPRTPASEPPAVLPVQVTTTPRGGHVAQQHPVYEKECASHLCNFMAKWLRDKLSQSVNPCNDFYGYVCGTFKGLDQLAHVKSGLISQAIGLLKEPKVPLKGQTSRQKAAALYQACILFVESNETKTNELVKWMKTFNLDLFNTSNLERFNPVEMIVRCSLDIGVPAIISITALPDVFFFHKRALLMEYSTEEGKWIDFHSKQSQGKTLEEYTRLLHWNKSTLTQNATAAKIIAYEKELQDITKTQLVPGLSNKARHIRTLAEDTTPYVNATQWFIYFSKYTNGIHNGDDWILHQPRIVDVLVNLLKSVSLGEQGLRYQIAWSVYRQLVPYTVPSAVVGGRTSKRLGCYEHVAKVAKLAIVSPFLQSHVMPDMVRDAEAMLNYIVTAFRWSVESSTWITGKAREFVLQRISSMAYLVESPGKRLDPAYVEDYYRLLSDMDPKELFPSWFEALSHSARSSWRDQKSWLYDETSTHAYYSGFFNTLIVPTLLLTHPLFYAGGPAALNYGGLGTVMGREITQIFDVYLEMAKENSNLEPGFKEQFMKRVECLRASDRSPVLATAGREVLNSTLDSLKLSDFMAVTTAYKAFLLLLSSLREMKLSNLNLSAKQLFFINYCVKLCDEKSSQTTGYSSFRSRCMVPLMNMPDFSKVFGCARGDIMNPQNKCTLW